MVVETLASGLYEFFSKELAKHGKVEDLLATRTVFSVCIGTDSESFPKPFFCSFDRVFEDLFLDNIIDHTMVD